MALNSGYNSKTLVGNWWEERCDPKFDDYNKRFQSVLDAPTATRW